MDRGRAGRPRSAEHPYNDTKSHGRRGELQPRFRPRAQKDRGQAGQRGAGQQEAWIELDHGRRGRARRGEPPAVTTPLALEHDGPGQMLTTANKKQFDKEDKLRRSHS